MVFTKSEMNSFKILILLSLLVLKSLNAFSQSNDSDIQAVDMLKKFYIVYSDVKLTVKDRSKFDSLQLKYFTVKLRNQVKQSLADGYDVMTHDWGITPESLKTLVINKDLLKKNRYLVSYITDTFPVSPNKPIKRKIVLYVGVVKECDRYKIESVE